MADDMTLKGAIIDALSSLTEPRDNASLLDAHILEGVEVENGAATVTLAFGLDYPKEDRWRVEDAVTDAVEAVDGVSSADVRAYLRDGDGKVASPVAAPSAASPGPGAGAPAAGATAAQPNAPRSVEGVGRIIAVASGKGGVGKSTVAVNLALALQRLGFATGLLDVDVYGPSLPTLLGVQERPNVRERRILPLEVHGLKLMSLGFLMEEDTPVIWRGPIVTGIIRQFLQDVEWKPLDYLIVDMPPGTGDAQLSLAQSVPVDGAVIVTTPSDLALIDAARGLQMFRTLEIDVLGVVENMAYQLWEGGPEMRAALEKIGADAEEARAVLDRFERTHIFGQGGGAREAERLGVPFLGEVPLDGPLRAGGDAGRPIMLENPEGAVGQAFMGLAQRLVEVRPVEKDDEGKAKGKSVFSFMRH